MDSPILYHVETSASVEIELHHKLLNKLGEEGWSLINVVLSLIHI